jgi:hypothetical protein
MRRFAIVALAVVGFILPASAQRGMSHGGFAGHSAPAFHGGFAAPHFSGGFAGSRSYGFPAGPRYPVRPFTPSPLMARSSAVHPGFYPVTGFRSPYSGNEHNDGNGHNDGHSGGVHFVIRSAPLYPVPGWFGLGPLGYYPYGFGYDDSGAFADDTAANYGTQDYAAQPTEPEQPVYREEYEPSVETPQQPQVPESENATTIVFKDGRPSEQIHNYALTRTTLYILDEQRRDIPLDQLDLAATEKANHAAGIEFQVPQLVQ